MNQKMKTQLLAKNHRLYNGSWTLAKKRLSKLPPLVCAVKRTTYWVSKLVWSAERGGGRPAEGDNEINFNSRYPPFSMSNDPRFLRGGGGGGGATYSLL